MYSPLHEHNGTIRVLVLAPGRKGQPLKGRLIHVESTTNSHTKKPEHGFDALSYCWGNDPATESILIGGTGLNITPNLYDALQHLRSEEVSQNLWIDQICINQKDIIERNQQVEQMDVVYAGAREVVAWLGNATPESRVILGGLCKVADEAFKELTDEAFPCLAQNLQERGPRWMTIRAELCAAVLRHHPDPENVNDWSEKLACDFRALLQNPWFRRMWIVQETALPKRLFFQSGGDRLSWWKLFAVLSDADFRAQIEYDQKRWIEHMRLLRAVFVYGNLPHFTLGSLVSLFHYQQSKNPRDKVYALVGLESRLSRNSRGVDPNLKVDYSKSVAQVFTDLVVRDAEGYRDLRLLSQCCSERGTLLQGLPSWTVDWTQGLFQQSCLRLLEMHFTMDQDYKACGSHDAQVQYIAAKNALSVTGLDFDVVDEISVGPPTAFNAGDTEMRRQPGIESSDSKYSVSLEWKSLALKSTSVDPYVTLGGRADAFCRTLILDKAREPVSSDVVQAFVSLWEGAKLDFRDIVCSAGYSPRTKCLDFKDWSTEFVSKASPRRKLFRTRRGYIGISCHHIKRGDKVCILWGGNLPFILRESGTLEIPNSTEREGKTSTRQVISHKLIGGYCYIYGLAGGEGIEIAEKEGLAPQEFFLV